MVQAHDPAGYWPGRLLPTSRMQLTYYTVRSFWIETGLRFGTTAKVAPNSTPAQHLDWWQDGIEELYKHETSSQPTTTNKENATDTSESALEDHPTFRLLNNLMYEENIQLSKEHFARILQSRRNDLDVTQYATLKSLEDHAEMSCGSLAQLVLEAGGSNVSTLGVAREATRLVGVCHGLTNALRTSIPVMSTTGKLIIPQDLCLKYGVKSPRFLLTALALGDEDCRHALQEAVRDIHHSAIDHLQQARQLRQEILNSPHGETAVAVLIPGVASEVFLNRLEQSNYDLTNRSLRHVGVWEHALCRARMTYAYYQRSY